MVDCGIHGQPDDTYGGNSTLDEELWHGGAEHLPITVPKPPALRKTGHAAVLEIFLTRSVGERALLIMATKW
jgi:hypothetical protein